ncbi:MAG: hypothetical protein Q9204_008957 [Flavoplaca sp. TL-2023a]
MTFDRRRRRPVTEYSDRDIPTLRKIHRFHPKLLNTEPQPPPAFYIPAPDKRVWAAYGAVVVVGCYDVSQRGGERSEDGGMGEG